MKNRNGDFNNVRYSLLNANELPKELFGDLAEPWNVSSTDLTIIKLGEDVLDPDRYHPVTHGRLDESLLQDTENDHDMHTPEAIRMQQLVGSEGFDEHLGDNPGATSQSATEASIAEPVGQGTNPATGPIATDAERHSMSGTPSKRRRQENAVFKSQMDRHRRGNPYRRVSPVRRRRTEQ